MKLSSLSDVIAGSEKESIVVDEVKNYMRELGVDVRTHPLEVLSWGDLECSVDSYPCVSLPPILGRNVYGVLTDDLRNCSGKVLLLNTTEFPDNVWVLYNLAVDAGADAVVFYDALPNRFRRIVVTGVWSYSFGSGSPPPIPAVHLRYEDGVKLRKSIGKRVEVRCTTELRLSTGYNVEGFIGGSKEEEIAIVAHHDRWFRGFRDDLVGTYTLLNVVDKGVSSRVKYTLRIISFTAEEFGNPNLSPWYWSYGSRTYVENVDLSNIEYVVNLDTACVEPIRVNATGPDVGKYFIKYSTTSYVYDGFDHPYSDGFSFSLKGIPTITLHNLRDIDDVYHTDLDIPYDVDKLVENLSSWIINAVNNYELNSLEVREYLELIKHTLPEDVRDLIDKVLTITDLRALIRFLRGVSRELVRPVVMGSYKDLNKDFITVLAPHALVVNNLRRGLRTDVRVPGTEDVLCCEGIDDELIRKYVKYIREVFENLIKDLT